MKNYRYRLFFIIVLITFAGFGCKSLSPAKQVVLEMKKNMVSMQSASIVFSLEGEGFDLIEDPVVAPLYSGKISTQFLGQVVQSDTGFDFDGAFDFTSVGETNNNLAGEVSDVAGKRYLMLSALDLDKSNLPAAASGIDFSMFLDKWFYMPGGAVGSNKLELTKSQKVKIYSAFIKANLFSEINELGEEEGGGVTALKYGVVLDEDSLVKMVKKITDIRDEDFKDSDENDLREMIQNLNQTNITIWVGKDDKMLHRLTFEPNSSGEIGSVANATIVFALSDFNQPVTIEAPQGAVSFQTFLLANVKGGAPVLPESSSNRVELPEGLEGLTLDGEFGKREFDEFQSFFEGQPKE